MKTELISTNFTFHNILWDTLFLLVVHLIYIPLFRYICLLRVETQGILDFILSKNSLLILAVITSEIICLFLEAFFVSVFLVYAILYSGVVIPDSYRKKADFLCSFFRVKSVFMSVLQIGLVFNNWFGLKKLTLLFSNNYWLISSVYSGFLFLISFIWFLVFDNLMRKKLNECCRMYIKDSQALNPVHVSCSYEIYKEKKVIPAVTIYNAENKDNAKEQLTYRLGYVDKTTGGRIDYNMLLFSCQGRVNNLVDFLEQSGMKISKEDTLSLCKNIFSGISTDLVYQ